MSIEIEIDRLAWTLKTKPPELSTVVTISPRTWNYIEEETREELAMPEYGWNAYFTERLMFSKGEKLQGGTGGLRVSYSWMSCTPVMRRG